MSEAWLGLIGTILGILLGFFLSQFEKRGKLIFESKSIFDSSYLAKVNDPNAPDFNIMAGSTSIQFQVTFYVYNGSSDVKTIKNLYFEYVYESVAYPIKVSAVHSTRPGPYTEKGGFAVFLPKHLYNVEIFSERVSVCDDEFSRFRNRTHLFLYYMTEKKEECIEIVTTDITIYNK